MSIESTIIELLDSGATLKFLNLGNGYYSVIGEWEEGHRVGIRMDRIDDGCLQGAAADMKRWHEVDVATREITD